MGNVKGKAEKHDREQEYLAVLYIHVRGYGKDRHVKQTAEHAKRLLSGAFDDVRISAFEVLRGEELEVYDTQMPKGDPV